MIPHLRCCQGLAVDYYGFALGRLGSGASSTFAQLGSYFEVFKDYQTSYEVLGAMVKFRCKRGCRENGGNPSCKIRTCCRKKALTGCWECDKYTTCAKLDALNATHGDAYRKNLNTLKRKGVSGFLSGKKHWYIKPKHT